MEKAKKEVDEKQGGGGWQEEMQKTEAAESYPRSFSWGFLALHWGKEKGADNTQAGCSGCIRQMAEGEGGREEVEGVVVDVFLCSLQTI